MKYTSPSISDKPLVLYHAVSSYQLLEVILHRMTYHSRERTVLILPDFITQKYPQYKKLVTRRLFNEVYLFPYLHILHREEQQIFEDVKLCYEQIIPHPITDFSEIYVAGAHFYFSLYLIQNRMPFHFFEDAAGMLSRSNELYETLAASFPTHARIARKHRLFNGENPYICSVICLKKAQTIDVSGERYVDFSVEEVLQNLPERKRNHLIHFFLKHRRWTKAEAILLTQHFAHLNMMSEEEQIRSYKLLRVNVLQDVPLIIKKHPDDFLNYRKIFPDAECIKEIFPAELLPYVFWHKPTSIYTFDSTSCENLGNHFLIQKIERKSYAE